MNLNVSISISEFRARAAGLLRSPRIQRFARALPLWIIVISAAAALAVVALTFYRYAYLPSHTEPNPQISPFIISERKEFREFTEWLKEGPRKLNEAPEREYNNPFR